MNETLLRAGRILLISKVALGFLPPLTAGEALPPPFGLQWGAPPGRLVDWAVRTKLDHLVKSPAEDPRLKIHMINAPKGSLPGHEATMLEARFVDGQLFEVTLHFTYPGKTSNFVRGRFAELKSILTRRHGAFKPAGEKSPVATAGIATHSTAYRIDPASDRHLLLVLTEVTDLKRGDTAAQFSVMYHNSNVLNGEGPRIVIRRDGVDFPGGATEP